MFVETLSMRLRKARSVNQTSNGYVSKVPTITEPAGDAGTATGASVIDVGGKDPLTAQNSVYLRFFGTGSNNNTFSCRVYGWAFLPPADPSAKAGVWVPTVLAEFAVTLSSNVPGVAGGAVLATELFADTITLSEGNNNVSVDIVSPADDASIASALLDLKGCQKLELSFTTGGVATDCNALLTLL